VVLPKTVLFQGVKEKYESYFKEISAITHFVSCDFCVFNIGRCQRSSNGDSAVKLPTQKMI